MRFTADTHAAIADGGVTVTFRAWKRPQVKPGGRYRVGAVVVAVTAVDRLPISAISAVDVTRAGFATREGLLARLAQGRRDVKLSPEFVVYRVEFHVVGEPAPVDRRAWLAADDRLTAADVEAIAARLDRIDRNSKRGPWTRPVLQLIAARPGVVSTELAREVGRDRKSFKADVRKLKDLGLTESLEVGYRLSPRGRAFVARGA